MKRMVRPVIITLSISLMIMLVLTISVSGTNNLFAAKKILDVKATNVNLNSNVEGTVCGVSGEFTVKTHISKYRLIRWDNGHSTNQITFDSKTYDSDGKLIAIVPVVDRFSQSFNVNAVCTGNSETPGKSQNFFFRWSVAIDPESGEVISISAIAQPL